MTTFTMTPVAHVSERASSCRPRGIDTALVTGTVANLCCESTAREASTLGYRVVMVADANAAMREEDLNATLHTIDRSFGDVRPTAQIVDLVRADRTAAGRRPSIS